MRQDPIAEWPSREVEVAARAARTAGAAALGFYGRVDAEIKDGGSPVTAADHAANAVILEALRDAFPDDAILSEESADSPDRLGAARVWIVDPLDGTKEFIAQNGEFSIMIGLVDGGDVVAGVVYQPTEDRLYWAALGEGAWVDSAEGRSRLECIDPQHPARLVGSRSHPDKLLVAMSAQLGITDVRPSGSVGIKCSLIVRGERDLYVHPVPYLREWDTCAPELLVREAGGRVVDCRGEPLRYNQPDPRQRDGIVAGSDAAVRRALPTIIEVYANSNSNPTASS